MTHRTDLTVGPAAYTQGGFICIGFYEDGGAVALSIVDADGFPEAKATVNMPEITVTEGLMILKNWSENEGIPEALVKAGLVELTGLTVTNGFVNAPLARPTAKLAAEIEKARGQS